MVATSPCWLTVNLVTFMYWSLTDSFLECSQAFHPVLLSHDQACCRLPLAWWWSDPCSRLSPQPLVNSSMALAWGSCVHRRSYSVLRVSQVVGPFSFCWTKYSYLCPDHFQAWNLSGWIDTLRCSHDNRRDQLACTQAALIFFFILFKITRCLSDRISPFFTTQAAAPLKWNLFCEDILALMSLDKSANSPK